MANGPLTQAIMQLATGGGTPITSGLRALQQGRIATEKLRLEQQQAQQRAAQEQQRLLFEQQQAEQKEKRELEQSRRKSQLDLLIKLAPDAPLIVLQEARKMKLLSPGEESGISAGKTIDQVLKEKSFVKESADVFKSGSDTEFNMRRSVAVGIHPELEDILPKTFSDFVQSKTEPQRTRLFAEEIARQQNIPLDSQEFSDLMISIGTRTGLRESAFEREAGKSAATRVDQIFQQGIDASTRQRTLDSIRNLEARTGRFEATKLLLAETATGLGVPIDIVNSFVNLPALQSFNVLSNRLVTELLKEQKGVQSDADLQFFLRSIPGIQNVGMANQYLFNVLQNENERAIERAEFFRSRGPIRTTEQENRLAREWSKQDFPRVSRKFKQGGIPFTYSAFKNGILDQIQDVPEEFIRQAWLDQESGKNRATIQQELRKKLEKRAGLR